MGQKGSGLAPVLRKLSSELTFELEGNLNGFHSGINQKSWTK